MRKQEERQRKAEEEQAAKDRQMEEDCDGPGEEFEEGYVHCDGAGIPYDEELMLKEYGVPSNPAADVKDDSTADLKNDSGDYADKGSNGVDARTHIYPGGNIGQRPGDSAHAPVDVRAQVVNADTHIYPGGQPQAALATPKTGLQFVITRK